MTKEIRLRAPADFHVHLRQGEMCSLVTPLVRAGGFKVAYVMVCTSLRLEGFYPIDSPQPNLTPPITTTDMALKYKSELEAIDPTVQYLMTLYLSPELTVEEVRKAAKAGISGWSSTRLYASLGSISGNLKASSRIQEG